MFCNDCVVIFLTYDILFVCSNDDIYATDMRFLHGEATLFEWSC